MPDVEGDNEDNDDDGGEEHHPHDEERGAGHCGAVGQGRRCTLHPAPEAGVLVRKLGQLTPLS